jgi:hypothetical protein
MLILLTGSSVTVGPSPALVISTIIALMAICAAVVTVMKGRWGWVIIGVFTSGLGFFYSAFLPPRPDSLWGRRIARRQRRRARSAVR